MTKFGDVMLSIVFTLIFGFYSLQVFAFGGLTGESPFFYSLSSFLGILLIYLPFQDKYNTRCKLFMGFRFLAICLLLPPIYFDLKHDHYFQKAAAVDKILIATSHVMTVLVILYAGITIFRGLRISKEHKATMKE